jgi:hypothetical protein
VETGYQEAFLMIFFFFAMEFWLSRSLLHELFFFHDGNWLSGSLSYECFSFSRWNSQDTRFGGGLYIYIYRLVKNLASWLRSPFARKRVRSSLF